MICLVGDILTDVTLATTSNPLKMRLGGIVHAARALWALDVEYAVAYFAPSYMDDHINMYLREFNCKFVTKLGNVANSPFTMLIQEAKEVGDQGYEFLYHEGIKIQYDSDALKRIKGFDNLFFIAGNYDMRRVLNYVDKEAKVHYDVSNTVTNLLELPKERCFDTIFVSTSSILFRRHFTDFESFCNLLNPFTKRLVLKENRGGSRLYDYVLNQVGQIPSQTTHISHSVGVGDVYDVVAISSHYDCYQNQYVLASWIAMEYALTTFPDDFKRSVKNLLKVSIEDLKSLGGCILPWEVRQNCNIYIAAPDFDYMDTRFIDQLCDSLLYHNFTPRRPIKENGQMSLHPSKTERQMLFHKDMELLDECNMMIAVLLNNDPGTLIEIGMSVDRGLPTLVFDPYGIADNCMLTECPTLISSDLDAIISKVFIEYSNLHKNGTI